MQRTRAARRRPEPQHNQNFNGDRDPYASHENKKQMHPKSKATADVSKYWSEFEASLDYYCQADKEQTTLMGRLHSMALAVTADKKRRLPALMVGVFVVCWLLLTLIAEVVESMQTEIAQPVAEAVRSIVEYDTVSRQLVDSSVSEVVALLTSGGNMKDGKRQFNRAFEDYCEPWLPHSFADNSKLAMMAEESLLDFVRLSVHSDKRMSGTGGVLSYAGGGFDITSGEFTGPAADGSIELRSCPLVRSALAFALHDHHRKSTETTVETDADDTNIDDITNDETVVVDTNEIHSTMMAIAKAATSGSKCLDMSLELDKSVHSHFMQSAADALYDWTRSVHSAEEKSVETLSAILVDSTRGDVQVVHGENKEELDSLPELKAGHVHCKSLEDAFSVLAVTRTAANAKELVDATKEHINIEHPTLTLRHVAHGIGLHHVASEQVDAMRDIFRLFVDLDISRAENALRGAMAQWCLPELTRGKTDSVHTVQTHARLAMMELVQSVTHDGTTDFGVVGFGPDGLLLSSEFGDGMAQDVHTCGLLEAAVEAARRGDWVTESWHKATPPRDDASAHFDTIGEALEVAHELAVDISHVFTPNGDCSEIGGAVGERKAKNVLITAFDAFAKFGNANSGEQVVVDLKAARVDVLAADVKAKKQVLTCAGLATVFEDHLSSAATRIGAGFDRGSYAIAAATVGTTHFSDVRYTQFSLEEGANGKFSGVDEDSEGNAIDNPHKDKSEKRDKFEANSMPMQGQTTKKSKKNKKKKQKKQKKQKLVVDDDDDEDADESDELNEVSSKKKKSSKSKKKSSKKTRKRTRSGKKSKSGKRSRESVVGEEEETGGSDDSDDMAALCTDAVELDVEDWTGEDVANWLECILDGDDSYRDAIMDEEVDGSNIKSLTDEALKEAIEMAWGHRILVIGSIKSLE